MESFARLSDALGVADVQNPLSVWVAGQAFREYRRQGRVLVSMINVARDAMQSAPRTWNPVPNARTPVHLDMLA